MGAMDDPAGQVLNPAPSERSAPVSEQPGGALEPLSRALRISADTACLALLLYSWFADRAQLAHLITLWATSNVAIPWPRIRERLRQHSVATAVILLLGLGLIVATLSRVSPAAEAPGLYHFRNVFQGLMFALAGLSNLIALRAYPERKTTSYSLGCGTASVVSGIAWVWLALQG